MTTNPWYFSRSVDELKVIVALMKDDLPSDHQRAHDELLIQSSRLSGLIRDRNQGIIGKDSLRTRINQIGWALEEAAKVFNLKSMSEYLDIIDATYPKHWYDGLSWVDVLDIGYLIKQDVPSPDCPQSHELTMILFQLTALQTNVGMQLMSADEATTEKDQLAIGLESLLEELGVESIEHYLNTWQGLVDTKLLGGRWAKSLSLDRVARVVSLVATDMPVQNQRAASEMVGLQAQEFMLRKALSQQLASTTMVEAAKTRLARELEEFLVAHHMKPITHYLNQVSS